MRGFRSLSSGLLAGADRCGHCFQARWSSPCAGSPSSISELPIPTVTLQIDCRFAYASPTPTGVATQPAISCHRRFSPAATPTPTVCPIPPDWQRYSVGPFDTLISDRAAVQPHTRSAGANQLP